MRSASAFAAASLLPLLASCGDLTPPVLSQSVTVPVAGVPGLVQTLRVEPQELRTDGAFAVASVLRNTGSAATPAIAVSICGVSTRGTFEYVDPSAHCAGYSVTMSLAPGDSVVDG